MKHGSEKIIGQAICDPEKVYKTPAAVTGDPRLTPEEKKKILESWELDEISMMRAETENMLPKREAPRPPPC